MTESNMPPSGSTPPPAPGTGAPPPPIDYGGPKQRGPVYTGPEPTKDDKTMAMLCHLLGIFTGFLGPLIIWLIKKDTSPFVDDQGKEALNFQLVCMIAALVCIPLVPLACIGLILGLAVQVVRIIFSIIGTIEANKGVPYRYPLTWRMIK